MRPTLYIETTIPSYYFDRRVELASDTERTRHWWDSERGEYECFVSAAVLEELSRGSYSSQADCLDLVRSLPVLEVTQQVLDIARIYQLERIMPAPPSADAVHVAVASHYRLDYLLTWNCSHLANARKFDRLDALNTRLHLGTPRLVTPQILRPLEEP
jgi:predicted nucleic acid-binding protein